MVGHKIPKNYPAETAGSRDGLGRIDPIRRANAGSSYNNRAHVLPTTPLPDHAHDFAAFDERADEPLLTPDELLADLKAHGTL